MLYKCNYCDPTVKRGEKPIKSIDTEKDNFIKDEKGKYYHTDCFRKHLIKRKKMSNDDQINEIIDKLASLTAIEVKESEEKDRFLKWIINFYDGSLPTYFLKKLQSVRNGTHESINEPVPYETLLDIYQYMEKYLRKLSASKKIENVTQRMNYDLAVVIGNYGDYKKFKRKQHAFSIEQQEVDKQIEIGKKLTESSKDREKEKEKIVNEGEDFDITDIIDELLL